MPKDAFTSVVCCAGFSPPQSGKLHLKNGGVAKYLLDQIWSDTPISFPLWKVY